MSQAKSVAQGFLVAATAIWLFDSLWLGQLNAWIAIGLFLSLLIPFAIRGVRYLKNMSEKQPVQTRIKQAKNVLMALQGGGFACWFADIISTIFVLDISQTGYEANPLGWPFGAIGALTYFVPITFVVYYLLYKNKAATSFYGAFAVTVVSVAMGTINFSASQQNLNNVARVNWQASNAGYLIFSVWLIIYLALLAFNIALLRKTNPKKSI